jgi:hypothetical protein
MITVEQAREGLRKALEEKGEDYVYPHALTGENCVYAEPDGSPSCLVGHAIYYIDREAFNALAAEEAEHWDEEMDGLPITSVRSIDIDKSALRALAEAQDIQDTKGTWGAAFKGFEVTSASIEGGTK